MRLAERGEMPLPAAAPASPPPEEERCKVRLRLRKDGPARFVSHLEFMTVFHRAVRRAGLPVRFSGGFHPAPRISFPDALPTGVESDAEIIDLELFRPCGARETVEAMNEQLPAGFQVLEGAVLPWQTPSPSATIRETVYRVELPPGAPAELSRRLADFLDRETVTVTRERRTADGDRRPARRRRRCAGGGKCPAADSAPGQPDPDGRPPARTFPGAGARPADPQDGGAFLADPAARTDRSEQNKKFFSYIK